MLKNYLLAALRNLRKQKVYSLINLFGLGFGMAGFAIFALMAGTKSQADRFHENARGIYGVVQVLQSDNEKEEHTTFLPAPLATVIKEEFPEVLETVRVWPVRRMTMRHRNSNFYQTEILFVDPQFLTTFSFDMTAGNPLKALDAPNSIVLTENTAAKYFGDENPLGQVLTLENKTDITVTGILKNVTRTSSIRFDVLVSMDTAKSLGIDLHSWENHTHAVFLLVEKHTDEALLEEKLQTIIDKYYKDSREKPKKMYLLPFLDFRLKASTIKTFMATSNPASVFIGLFLGTLLLLIVCINFINLSTARSMHRLKEVGMRKVIGARRSQLIRQFLGESLLLSLLSLPVAVILYELIQPLLSSYLGDFALIGGVSHVSNSILNYPFLWKYLLVAVVLTGLFSGLYPALFLSSFRPVPALKGRLQTGRNKRKGSKALIVIQFALSILFIAFAGILKNQAGLIIKSDFGFNREHVAVIPLTEQAVSQLEMIKTEIKRHPEIISVTASADIPLIWSAYEKVKPTGAKDEEAVSMEAYGIGYEFIETLQMELLEGRSFNKAQEDSSGFVINETAAKKLPWENPLGQSLTIGERTGPVIGVVRDFLFDDIGFSLPPAVMFIESKDLRFLMAKYSSSSRFEEIRSLLEEKWQSFYPDLPFVGFTLDQHFQDTLGLVNRISGLFNMLGLAAVLFSCLGLLGLISFMLERRTKEIGIRRVLGASVRRITYSIIRDYLLLIVIANVIALTLIYFGWSRLLKTGLLFITPLSLGIYAGAFFVSTLTAVLAVVPRTWKAAVANPVDSLRYE